MRIMRVSCTDTQKIQMQLVMVSGIRSHPAIVFSITAQLMIVI